MSEFITGFHYDIGGREVYEDRVDIQEFTTSGNLSLRVAVVADGVGGENRGERASQLAIDTFFRTMRSSGDGDVPTLLRNSVTAANQAVHGIIKETGGASTTISVAAVLDDETLFVANVGDSRVYLCRDRNLTQLTIDHTYANVMPWRGQISPAEARANPRAEALMRAIGPRAQIPVDIGFYVNTIDPRVAHKRGLGGLPLRDGDAILVCSDGLTKISRRTGEPFTTDEEIVRVLTTQEGDKAARSLVSFALGRDVDDNVSAAVMQMPDPSRRRRARRPYIIGGGAVATLILIAAIVAFLVFQRQGEEQASLAATATTEALGAAETATRAAGAIATSAGEANVLSQAATGTVEAAATMTAIVAAFTPTPTPTETSTPTPRPTRIANQIGIFLSGSEARAFTLADPIVTGNIPGELHINHDEALIDEDASIFAEANTEIRFENVTADPAADAGISLQLFEGSEVFIESGGYVNGVDVSPIGDTRISFLVTGSCISVQYDATESTVTMGCYEGNCGYRAQERDALTVVARGDLVVYDVSTRQETEMRRIRSSEGNHYRQILQRSSAGNAVYGRCILPLFPPTPTPTHTPTPKPTATSTRAPSGGGGSSPPPQPTNTRRPPTNTPQPSPTSTPCLGTSCQGTLPSSLSAGSLGMTAGWISLGLVIGLVFVFERPRKRQATDSGESRAKS